MMVAVVESNLVVFTYHPTADLLSLPYFFNAVQLVKQ